MMHISLVLATVSALLMLTSSVSLAGFSSAEEDTEYTEPVEYLKDKVMTG